MNGHHKTKNLKLVNFKLSKKVVETLDQLVQTGLYKSRVDIVLAALRNYEPFKTKWKENHRLNKQK
jgi:Arc/MetJ-type ribon-helix-helix transcriptional regulator